MYYPLPSGSRAYISGKALIPVLQLLHVYTKHTCTEHRHAQTYIHMYTHTHTHACTHTKLTDRQTHMHARTHTKLTDTHVHTHTHTHTTLHYTHVHTHTYQWWYYRRQTSSIQDIYSCSVGMTGQTTQLHHDDQVVWCLWWSVCL